MGILTSVLFETRNLIESGLLTETGIGEWSPDNRGAVDERIAALATAITERQHLED